MMLFGLSCANQGLPPGGPEDKTPPQIVGTVPEKNAIRVRRDTRIEFEFSEKIDSRSPTNSVFISPNPGKDVEIKVSGNRLRVSFPDSLRDGTTYTVTVGTEIKDLRGNALAESYTLGFSTGGEIDSREISGRVFAEKVNQVTVWGYILEDSGEIDPTSTAPTYLTQCNQKGEFRLANLAARTYRLFAVRDLNRDQRYNRGAEEIGITSSDVDLTGNTEAVTGKLFRMMSEDTSEVNILSLDQTDNRHMRVRFSRAVTMVSDIGGSVSLLKGETNLVTVGDVIYGSAGSEVWTVTTAARDSAGYVLRIFNLQDKNSRPLSDSVYFEFASVAVPDTTRPRIEGAIPPDSARTLGLTDPLRLHFTEGMDTTEALPVAALLQDSVRSSSYIGRWLNPHEYLLQPDNSWNGKAWLQLKLNAEGCKDLAGNTLAMSKLNFAWRALNPDTLSSVSGLITDRDSLAAGAFFLQLRQEGGGRTYETEQRPDAAGYVFEKILPGKYLLNGFRDEDGNRVYSFGSSFPFSPSERFFFAGDTILVRAKWPNEGNDYEMDAIK